MAYDPTTGYSEPTQVQQYQTGFAPEIAPYAQTMLGQAAALTDITQNPYQQYQGERQAQFSPLQNQSYQNAGMMQAAPQLQDASALAGTAGLGALNTSYTYNPSNFTSADASRMMNPYTQNVMDVQTQQAKRQAAIAAQTQQAQAARSGAFGGSGDYLMRSQGNADLQRNLANIQATGLNTAYNNAQNQYNTQAQLNAQQGQFGANLGMQGLQAANQSAQNLANIGQTQYSQNMGINQMQNQYGLQQQQQVQQDLTNKYQDYLNYQNYPYKQLGFMSDMIRGAPLTQQSSSIYQAAPSLTSQAVGLGTAALGVSKLMASGGSVNSRSAGLVDLALARMA